MNERRPCPYCAEEIAAAAIKCPHCRSRLTTFDATAWHRDHGDRKVGGVASAIAHATAVPVGAVRIGFVALTVVHFLGPILYGLGWLAIPRTPGTPSVVERALDDTLATLRRWRGRDDAHTSHLPGGPVA